MIFIAVAGQPSNTVDLTKTQSFSTPNSQMSFSNRPAVTAATATTAVTPTNLKPAAATLSPAVKGGGGTAGHTAVNGHNTGKVDVDSFVPDEGDFDNFLDEADTNKERSAIAINNVDSR